MLKTVGNPSTRYGDQTIADGNLIIGTAGKGIDFSANGGDLLSQYEEGVWTPSQGSGLTVVGAFTSSGLFTRIGRVVHVQGKLQGATSIACSAFGVLCDNLPFNLFPNEFVGSLYGGTPASGGTTTASGLTLYSINAISAGGAINFNFVCSIT
jgi:hypothetical protein